MDVIHILQVHEQIQADQEVNAEEVQADDPTPADTEDEVPHPPPARHTESRDRAQSRDSSASEHRPSRMPSSSRRYRDEDEQDLLETLSGNAERSSQCADAMLQLTQAILQSRQGNRQLRTFTDYLYEVMVDMPEEQASQCQSELFTITGRYRVRVRM